MSRKKRLGRGLDALLGAEPPAPATASGAITSLPIDRLEPNRLQPRRRFDESALDSLAESIRAQGIVQPIVVTRLEGEEGEEDREGEAAEERWSIIAGERRWRAARKVGLAEVPVTVREVGEAQSMLEMALVENIQRQDLDPIEEAEAYQLLAERFGLSQDAVAERVGKARTTVTNALRLLRLPEAVRDMIQAGELSAGQARPLLAVPEAERQEELAREAVKKALTARDVEALAGAAREEQEAAEKKKKSKKTAGEEADVHTRAAMDQLTRRLQTRVEIRRRRRGGGIIRIHFHSEDELIRLYDELTAAEKDD